MSDWPQLTAICCDLAREQMYDEAPPDAVTARARRARAMLKRLASGEARLVDANGMAPRLQKGALASRAGPRPVMTSENLAGFGGALRGDR